MRGSLSAAYCDSGKSGEGVQSFYVWIRNTYVKDYT